MMFDERFLHDIVTLAREYASKGNLTNINNLIHYITDLINLINEERKLDEFLSDFKFVKYAGPLNLNVAPAAYVSQGREVLIYVNQIMYLYNHLSETFIDVKDDINYACLLAMLVYHELEHVNQNIYIKNGEDGLEKDLVETSLFITDNIPPCIELKIYLLSSWIKLYKIKRAITSIQKLYSTYHDYAPYERLANIYTDQLLLSMAKYLEKDDLVKSTESLMKIHYGVGYDAGSYPVAEFFKQANLIAKRYPVEFVRTYDYEQFNERSKSLSLEERFKLGMELTKEEYEEGIIRLNLKN